MYSNEIIDFINKHNLVDKTVESFFGCLKYYDDISTIDVDLIVPYVHSIAIKAYNWPELDLINYEVELKISYMDDEIGIYKLYCDLNGEITDDVLLMH